MTYKESSVKPFYTLDLECDEDILHWLNEIYQWRSSDREETQRIEKQTTYLALYLNFSPANHRVFTASASGALRVFDKRDYYHLIDPVVASIVNNWTSRLTARKPYFSVFSKRTTDPSLSGKAEVVKSILNAYFQQQHAQELDELNIRNSFIHGESYLEIRWNPDKGPLDADIQEDLKRRGAEALEEYGEDASQIRCGDVESVLHDARNVVVQRAALYEDAEWVLILDVVSTERLKVLYPDFDDRIVSTGNPRVYSYDMLSPTYGLGYTLLFRFYHRPCRELPSGAHIIATPEVILENNYLPATKWISKQRLPVLQLPDSRVLGTSRGHSSTIMDATAFGQIALNNLWLQALTNIATFSPKLLAQVGSIDLASLRTGERTILQYKRSQAPPHLMAQEVVSQSHMLMIDKLKESLLRNANVPPVVNGGSMPNVESRKMLDFVKEQQDLQSVPKDVQHNRFLTDWASLVFELMSDKYSESEERTIQYFGSLRKYEKIIFNGKDLDIDVDISIETQNIQSATIQGRLQEMQTILSVVPGFYSPAEIVDQLHLGSPEKIYDEVTESIEAVRQEISNLLSGKTVKSPTRQINLLTYYDGYVQAMQKKEIQAILPERYDPDADDIGNRFLSQVATLESLLLDMLKDPGQQGPQGPIPKGDLPILMPQLQVPAGTTIRQYLYGRYPTFPMIYQPDPIEVPNPILAQQQAQMQQFAQTSPQNIMSPVDQAPVMPNAIPGYRAPPAAASPSMQRPQQPQ